VEFELDVVEQAAEATTEPPASFVVVTTARSVQ
jgi:hypothetical protein